MKTFFKTSILLITLLCFAYSNVHSQGSQVYLNSYELVSGPIDIQENGTNILDLSGVTYNPVTETLFMITNKSDAEIYETDLSGQILRRIDLADSYSNRDPEDIVHMHGNTFAIAEEKLGRVVYVDIFQNTTFIDLSDGTTNTIVQLPGSWPMGDGIEGVSYNPATEEIHAVSENTRQWYKFDESGSNVNASLQPCTLLDSQPNGTDLSAIHHFGLTDGIAVSDRMLVLSDESSVLVEMDENCNEYSSIDNMPGAQLEGVTMDGKGNIYVVGEPNELFIYSINCRTRDSLILLDFKQNISGLTSWNPNQPIDTWGGVTLNDDGCVKWITLDEANLSGTISPSLGGLSELTHLDLFRNDLIGPIPPELGNLSNLLYMDLNDNQLTGTIPVELSNLSELRRLNLSTNQLTGTIPTELSNLSLLTTLYLGSNQLSGSISPELGNLSKLVYLYLNHNQLTGTIPSDLGSLVKLKKLRLDNNQLSGQLPAELGQLVRLRLMYVHENQLSGTIPVEFGNLIWLTHLYMYSNSLSGSIPVEFGNLTKLIRLYMYSNSLSGQIPVEFGNLTKLTHLYMHGNSLSGTIPAEFGNMTNLKNLHLGYNNLTGELPGELGNLPKLIYLRVRNNDLSGCYDANLFNLCGQLRSAVIHQGNDFEATWGDFCNSGAGVCISISTCRQTDSLALVALYNATDGANSNSTWDLTQPVDTWYGITTDANGCVSRITLDEQDLTGTIPAWLGNLAYLTHLDLFGNDLTGPIPPQLGNLSNLLYMDLNYNELNGTIPVELSNLSNLRRLNLGSNQLTGTIPPQLGNLSSLTSLLLSGNQLSGSIPSELGNLSELVYLYLNHNDLIGTIPSELGNLINLSKLLLDNNQLTGEILASFGSLPDLTVLRVADNQLSGCYDDNLLNLCNQLSDYSNNNEIISDGNNFDTPWETFCSAGYCVQTKVAEEDNNYVLQNYPNPFSTDTTIEYDIPENAVNPTLQITDINGKLVYSQSIEQTGTGSISIEASTLASGVYHYRLVMSDAVSATKRMVIMK